MKRIIKSVFWIVIIITIILAIIITITQKSKAETNITSTYPYYYAWNDVNGFWDFLNTQTISVYGERVTGYASSSIGDISLDCATTRAGNICGISNYGVCNGRGATHNVDGSCSNADASGNLSGFAWNDEIGWISFCGGLNTPSCPGTISYGVSIDSQGFFSGYAWNDIVGWISFNCNNNGSCGTINYAVNTNWRSTSTVGYLESVTIDALSTTTLQSIIWQGSCGLAGTNLGFQIAVSSNPSGPWVYKGPSGTDSDWFGSPCSVSLSGGATDSCPPPNSPICVTPGEFTGRYFRYKVRLQSNLLQNSSPRVDNIILNFTK